MSRLADVELLQKRNASGSVAHAQILRRIEHFVVREKRASKAAADDKATFRSVASRLHHEASSLHTIFELMSSRPAIFHHIRAAFVWSSSRENTTGIFALASTLLPISYIRGRQK
jgi:hypothetical protein